MRIQMFLFVSSFALAAGAHAADWRDISFKTPVGERDEPHDGAVPVGDPRLRVGGEEPRGR